MWWTFVKAVLKRFQPEFDIDISVWVQDESQELEGKRAETVKEKEQELGEIGILELEREPKIRSKR